MQAGNWIIARHLTGISRNVRSPSTSVNGSLHYATVSQNYGGKQALSKNEFPLITSPLPARLAPLVMALRRVGFRTYASSMGGPDCQHNIPTVQMEPGFGDVEDLSVTWTGYKLQTWCVDHGVVARVCEVHPTIDEARDHLSLEVLDTLRDSYPCIEEARAGDWPSYR